ncbi:MAG: PIN domain-containing protein [Terriglobales bacterium]
MRAALDTNLLVYAEDVNSPEQGVAARELIARLAPGQTAIALQGLVELFNVLTRKAGCSGAEAQQRVSAWAALLETVPTDAALLNSAMDLAAVTDFRIWDAIHLAAAEKSHCKLFLSEDLQHGFHWRGVTVVNPFATPRHPLLVALCGT